LLNVLVFSFHSIICPLLVDLLQFKDVFCQIPYLQGLLFQRLLLRFVLVLEAVELCLFFIKVVLETIPFSLHFIMGVFDFGVLHLELTLLFTEVFCLMLYFTSFVFYFVSLILKIGKLSLHSCQFLPLRPYFVIY
jgi:hypothetical protein